MKKIVALALCLVMVLGLMTGCQKKGMDAKTLLQKMDEAMKDVTAEGMDGEMDMEMKMSTMGVTMTIGMEMDMEIQAKSDFSAMYMDMSMAVKAMGESEETKMEMYGTMEDGQMVIYAYESTEDIWVKTVQDGFGESMNLFMGMEQSFTDLPEDWFSVAKKQETINGRKCYVLTQQTDGAYIQEQMGDYVTQMLSQMVGAENLDEASMDEIKALMEDLDWSKLSGTTVYYVDAETFLTQEMTAEILGMGDVYNSMINALMEEMMMEMDEEVPAFSIEVPTFKIVSKNMTYNDDVEVPEIPQEAIDNAIDTDAILDDTIDDDIDYSDISTIEPQADGSYQLAMGGAYIRVMVPEDYIVYLADEEMIVGMTEDMMNSVSYMLMPEMTGEDMFNSFIEEIIWAQTEEYYKSHSDVVELNGWQTASLIYNDDTSLWYAWMELDGGCLLLSAEVEGETYDLESLIDTVTIAVN